MKKLLLIAVTVLSAASLSYAATAFAKIEDNHKCEAGFKCFACKGTGWLGEVRCVHCKGTGANSSY